MKFSEINFADYKYRRICVLEPGHTHYLPPDKDEEIIKMFGEREVEEITPDENGEWLKIKIK